MKTPVGQTYYFVDTRCPCYCGGEGILFFVTRPLCRAVMGRCDEAGELILDLRNPRFKSESSLAQEHVLRLKCGVVPYADFDFCDETSFRVADGCGATQYTSAH